MNKICCIIDFDGFTVRVSDNGGITYKSEFFIRELGFVRFCPKSLNKYAAKSYRFNLRGHLNPNTCSIDDWKTLEHQSRKIIGLPVFSTDREKAIDYMELSDIVRYIYEQCQNENADIVAFKGGHREKDLLSELEISSMNLESLGCPKYESLVKENNSKRPKDCGFHILAARGKVFHCAEAEVTAYRDWLTLNIRKLEQEGRCGTSEESSFTSSSAHLSWDQYTSSDSN